MRSSATRGETAECVANQPSGAGYCDRSDVAKQSRDAVQRDDKIDGTVTVSQTARIGRSVRR
jgi:hypothetical protein